MEARRIRPFDDPRLREPRSTAVLRRLLAPFIVVWITLAAWSGFRAIVQVFRLEVDVPAVVGPGSVIGIDVVASGRVPVTVDLDLVQDARVVPLASMRVATSRDPATDPRPRRGRYRIPLSAAAATRLAAGGVTVRATARGGSQFLRVPPPVVREVASTLERP